MDPLFERARMRRAQLGLPSAETSAYRLVHGAGDDLPELTVDVYDRWLVASLYGEQRGAREEGCLDALYALGFAGVYLKQRPKQANQLDAAERAVRAPERAVRGDDAPASLSVRESGMPFEVRLGDGLSTGLFLDQRDNRVRVRDAARGKRVLNLFAYTCAFGLAAALGGARSTTNLDVSRGALERGKNNYQNAGIDPAAHQFLVRDVLETLPRLARRGEQYELAILDPPSYASTKHGRFSVEHDYAKLVAGVLPLIAPGGALLACTNHQRLTDRDVGRAVQAAARELGRPLQGLDFMPPPADHPSPEGRPAHLKSVWVRV